MIVTQLSCVTSTARRLIGQIRRQPPLPLVDRLSLSFRIRGDLIFTQPADGEVSSLRMRKVQSADARGRGHRCALRQSNSDLHSIEQAEQLELLAVVRTSRIAECRTDAAVGFVMDVVYAARLIDSPRLA